MAALTVNFNQVTLQCTECAYHYDKTSILILGVPTEVLHCPNSECPNYNRYGTLNGSVTLNEVFISEAPPKEKIALMPPVAVTPVDNIAPTPAPATSTANLADVNQPVGG